ncbi:MAG: hypothetical protein JOZ83_08525 [Silvibacterium sp.]|nr:hypothetical protein [Silvibacterium sp.]
MSDVTVEASSPALVLVLSHSGASAPDSKSHSSAYRGELDGNVFVGLKYAMILNLVLAVSIAVGWKLYHLFS